MYKLQLVSSRPENMCLQIDSAFNDLKIGKYILGVKDILKKYTDITILNVEQVDAEDTPDAILVKGKFGKTNLSTIATGYKVVLLAYIYNLRNIPFFCPEFCIGANMIPALADIAKDSYNIGLWCPRLDLSQHFDVERLVTVLADGKEKTICC